MRSEPVILKVPANAEHMGLVRTIVGYFAGRENFTLDQIDDVKMAVDEAASQLVKQASGSELELVLSSGPVDVELRVGAAVHEADKIIDKDSFSWQILSALVDSVEVVQDTPHVQLIMVKRRLEDLSRRDHA